MAGRKGAIFNGTHFKFRASKKNTTGGNSGNITKAVDGISMYVDKGEFVAIMGASGSGKTTLLNCISTIDTVTSGHITVNNQDITKIKDKDFADFRRENLGFIFQDFNLLDTLTIGENISLSLVSTNRTLLILRKEFMLSPINWVFVIFYRNFLMKFLADKNSVVLVLEP